MLILSLHTLIDGGNSLRLAGIVNAAYVATAMVTFYPEHAEIYSVFTHPDHRSKGYAKSLINACLDAVRETELPAVALSVHHLNAAAIAVYSGFGFVPYSEVHEDGLVDYWLPLSRN